MPNLQLNAPAAPPPANKAAPLKGTSASPNASMPREDFSGLLQQLMTSEGISLAEDGHGKTNTPLEAAADKEPEEIIALAADNLPALPPPIQCATPPAVASAIPAATDGYMSALRQATSSAAEDPPGIPAGTTGQSSLPGKKTDFSDALTDAETAVAGQRPPQLLQHMEDAKLASAPLVQIESNTPLRNERIGHQEHQGHHEHQNTANTELLRMPQGLMLTELQQSSSTPLARIEPLVGTPQWNADFSQKIVWMAGEKLQSAQLHVNPPELGPIDILLSIDDKQASAIFTSPQAEVRQAIEDSLPRLREVLAENGVTLGNTSVTADSARDGSAYDQHRQPSPPYAGTRDSAATGSLAQTMGSPLIPFSSGSGLVDTFA